MNEHPSPTPSRAPIRARAVFAFVAFALLMPGVIFLSAGTTRWPMAWVYWSLSCAGALISRGIVALIHPDLLAERAGSLEAGDAKHWDRLLSPLIGLVGPLLIWIVCGLDRRWSWSPPLLPWVAAAALAVFIAGYALATWAMAANRFFSGVVRIQKERGHRVVTSGPYRVVRHPGYAGALVAMIAVPFMLGTLWGLVPVAAYAAAVAVRTALEDGTLQEELPGYREYAQRTRYRLLPGVC